MKPLYLDGGDIHVHLDGPALRVCKPATADQLFPFRRLSRVVSFRGVDWDMPALLACAGQGISVSFLDGEGELVARCIGAVDDREGIDQLLENLLYRSDWEPLYRQWLAAVENMALRSVVRQSGLPITGAPDAKDLARLFRQGAESMGAGAAFDRIGQILQGLLLGMVEQLMLDLGIDTSRYNRKSFNPARDIAAVLSWDFQLGRLRWLEQRLLQESAAVPPPRKDIVAWFESRRERTDRLARGILLRLHRWLLDG